MRLPLTLVLTCVVLSGGGLWVWAACSHSNALPLELYHDFGVIRHGLAKDHVFEIPVPRGDNGEELIPVTFWGDCICASGTILIQDTRGNRRLVASLARPDARVRPGEKVLLSLTLDTGTQEPVSVKRKLSTGKVTFESLRSTRPQVKHVPLEFHWGIHAPVRLIPVAMVDVGEVAYSQRFSQQIELHNNQPGLELRLGEIRVDDPRVTAKLVKGTPPGPYLLDIAFVPDRNYPTGSFTLAVNVPTNIRNDPKREDFYNVTIKVAGTVTDDVVVIPPARRGSHFRFDTFDFSQKKEEFVTVIDHDRSRPAGFVLEGIRNDNGVDISKHFQVRFEPDSRDDRRTRVWLTYLGTFEGTWLKGELSLAKNDKGPGVVTLRFLGLNSKR